MKLIISSLLFCVILCGCGDNQPQDVATEQKSTASFVTKCYTYMHDKDTVNLKTTLVNGSVTGMLMYNLYEKDKNTGTIQGEMKDSLLIADYTFMSEGVQSVRQVAFKMNGNTLTEGYGEIESNDKRASFKNIDALSFSNSVILTETACEAVK